MVRPHLVDHVRGVEDRATVVRLRQEEDIHPLGGGCFWCMEAVYKRITGVVAA